MSTAPTSLPLDQQLDAWQERSSEETEGRAEKDEAGFEALFDQTDVVSKQAEEYWQECVLRREFESDEAIFSYNGRTHQDRATIIDRLERDEDEAVAQIGASADETAQRRMKQKVAIIQELRSQVIMEQAWSDVAYLYDRRAKIESETRELAQNAQNQNDIEKLKSIAEKASRMADRLTKFGLYAESAVNLFKKYSDLAPDIAEFTQGYSARLEYAELVPGLADVTSPEPNQRYDSVMYQLLVSVESATGRSLEISGQGDRNYLTTFQDMRDKVLQVDYRRFVVLIAARVKQLEAELSEESEKETEPSPGGSTPQTEASAILQADGQTGPTDAAPGENILGGSFDAILDKNEEAIQAQQQQLAVAGKEEVRNDQAAIVTEKVPEKSDLKVEKEARAAASKEVITAAMNQVFAGTAVRNAT